MNLKKHVAILSLLILCMPLPAQVKEKLITVNFSKIPLSEAINRVEKVSAYTFFYDAAQVDLKQKVSLNVQNATANQAMDAMLKGTNIRYEVTNTQIALYPLKKAETASGKQITIKGQVIDNLGEPVIGANIIEEGTSNGVITDIDGNYTLAVNSGSKIQVSYIGYATQVLKASAMPSIVTLKEDSEMLQEVVVVGYGTMKKQDLTGAVASIKGDAMEKEQRQTIQDMLRTGVAGLSVGMETDAKGNTTMMIRGKSTIAASTDPLLVLDGVIYSGQMTDINPSDIERVDVLKDASSAAVYGAQAANGVVLITTKKGTASKKPTISFNGSWGVQMVNSLPDVYEGEDFVNFRQAVMNSAEYEKAATGYFDNPVNLTNTELAAWMGTDTGNPTEIWLNRLRMTNTEITNYLAGNTVDWKDLTLRTALRQDYTISIAGKKDEMSYYSSINYLKNESNNKGGSYSAIRARVNLENKVQQFLTYGVNAQFTSRDESNLNSTDNALYTSWSSALSPYGSVYNEDGTLKLYPNDNNNATNPLLNGVYYDKKYDINNLNASIYLKIDLPLGFSLQTTYSPRFEWVNYMHHRSADHPSAGDEGGYVHRYAQKDFYWQWDNMLKWNKKFGKHSFDFTGLVNWEKFQRWKTIAKNQAFQPSDNLGFGGIGYGTSPSVDAGDVYRTGDALMGRLHYSYDNRYLITATVRRDGYSAFGQANPHATFPSVALGWVFTEEPFWKNWKADWFEYGKLRFTYGENGNRSIGEYAALMQLEPRKYMYVDPATGQLININTFYCYNMANPNLKWETTTSYNLGLDLTFLQGRLNGSIDIYHKSTTDLLNNRQLPSLIGYSSVKANIGEIWNRGLELSLNSTNIQNDILTWRTSFNLTYNKNTIKHLYGIMEDVKDGDGNVIGQREADDITNGYFIGHALDEVWGYKFIGVWQENETEEAAKYGQRPGDPKILDKDQNYKYGNDDKEFLGNTTPKVRWNMRNEFTLFKNFDISFSMYSYLGHIKKMDRFTNNNALLNTVNQIKREYWTPDNPINDYPRLSAKNPGGITYYIYKHASFMRIDNISLGYTFPKRLLAPLKLEALRLNLSMKNVGYFTGWSAYDPENSDSNTPRTITFGINMTL